MKLLLASDLHYVTDLADEIRTNQHRLPARMYTNQIEGKLYWHNQMMVESGEKLLNGLEEIARAEKPDRLVFIGDMVNINWEKSNAAVAARFSRFPCPVRQVTGNHDIYLAGEESYLQEAVMPGSFETGLRHETVDGLGLIYLDLFAVSEAGDYRKWREPQATARIDYRPQDIDAAFALMAAAPEAWWLIFGHFPFVSPDDRVNVAGRKMGRLWPSTATVAAHLEQPNNLLGIVCGHQHFAHHQFFRYGFHWTLPSLVEYPCSAALLEWDGESLQGRIVTVDRELAATSLAARQESWTEGEAQDRHFVWRMGAK